MATATYTPIATQTLGSAASTITFSSIPQTYTDLRVVLTNITLSTASSLYMIYNGLTSGYGLINLGSNGSTATSASLSSTGQMPLSYIANLATTIPSTITVDIFSYANSTTFKSCLVTNAQDYNGSGAVEMLSGSKNATTAITSLTLQAGGGGNFNTGTIATLFGI